MTITIALVILYVAIGVGVLYHEIVSGMSDYHIEFQYAPWGFAFACFLFIFMWPYPVASDLHTRWQTWRSSTLGNQKGITSVELMLVIGAPILALGLAILFYGSVAYIIARIVKAVFAG